MSYCIKLSILTLCLVAGPIAAQGVSAARVATDYTGRVVAFESYGRLTESTPQGVESLFQFAGGTTSLLAGPRAPTEYPAAHPGMTDYGDILSYNVYQPGSGVPFGGYRPPIYTGTVRATDGSWSVTRPGRAVLSRGGRWAVFVGDYAHPSTLWMDLWTGREFTTGDVNYTLSSLADDGSIVTIGTGSLTWLRPGMAPVSLSLPFQPWLVVVDRNSRFAIAQADSSIWRVPLDGTIAEELIRDCMNCTVLDITADGRSVLYRQGSSVFYLPGNGAPLVELKGGKEALFTAGGSVVVYSHSDGIYRHDLATGEDELLVAGPAIRSFTPRLSPNMWVRTWGDGLRRAELQFCGRTIEPLTRTSADMTWLVPPDAKLGDTELRIGDPNSPFLPYTMTVDVEAMFPIFIQSRDANPDTTIGDSPYITHASDGLPVDTEHRAAPGEKIIVYMTGLNGQADRVRWMVGATTAPTEFNAPLISATEDPQHPGWTKVELQLPDTLPSGSAQLRIYWDSTGNQGVFPTQM